MRLYPLVTALGVCLAACGSSGGEVSVDAGADARVLDPDNYPRSFHQDDLLLDDDIFGGDDISVAQVQDFLEQQGSFLFMFSDELSGETAAQIIVLRSQAYGVNPLYMLARIQTESSLITSGSSMYLAQATGCGCPDGQPCNPELGGFGNQIECAAERMDAYVTRLDATGTTVSGWAVGIAKDTLDPCSVTPANRATAALYTYTPWVGAYAMGCGNQEIGGSSLVALSYNRFWAAYLWGQEPN